MKLFILAMIITTTAVAIELDSLSALVVAVFMFLLYAGTMLLMYSDIDTGDF
jgi:hypothetical protein